MHTTAAKQHPIGVVVLKQDRTKYTFAIELT